MNVVADRWLTVRVGWRDRWCGIGWMTRTRAHIAHKCQAMKMFAQLAVLVLEPLTKCWLPFRLYMSLMLYLVSCCVGFWASTYHLTPNPTTSPFPLAPLKNVSKCQTKRAAHTNSPYSFRRTRLQLLLLLPMLASCCCVWHSRNENIFSI